MPISFSGRFEPRAYTTSSGEPRVALEVHDAAMEYGPSPRTAEPATTATVATSNDTDEHDDIPLLILRAGGAVDRGRPRPAGSRPHAADRVFGVP